jgi:organic hydroperoxide reductase OsmC/OhrA
MSTGTRPRIDPSTHRARLTWNPSKDDLQAHTVELAEQTVLTSAADSLGGDAAKADPEEMFVAALSSCHMLWFVSLSRREKLRLTTYTDEAVGEMDGTRFTSVVLRPRVEFEEDPGPERIEALHHRAHELCFIANSVNCEVEVEPR